MQNFNIQRLKHSRKLDKICGKVWEREKIFATARIATTFFFHFGVQTYKIKLP